MDNLYTLKSLEWKSCSYYVIEENFVSNIHIHHYNYEQTLNITAYIQLYWIKSVFLTLQALYFIKMQFR